MEKSWVIRACSMARAASTAPPSSTAAYGRPSRRGSSWCPCPWRHKETAITAVPTTAPARPIQTPRWPRRAFTAGPPAAAWPAGPRSTDGAVRRPHPVGVRGDVVGGVLHQDRVRLEEGRAGRAEVADDDHRDVGLEELGRRARVVDPDR